MTARISWPTSAGQRDARRVFGRRRTRTETLALSGKSDKIEGACGSPLEWDTKEGRRACRTQKTYATGGYRDEDAWEAVYAGLAEALAQLELALKPHLKRL